MNKASFLHLSLVALLTLGTLSCEAGTSSRRHVSSRRVAAAKKSHTAISHRQAATEDNYNTPADEKGYDEKMKQHGMVDVMTLPGSEGLTLDLKYATTDNFAHVNMYGALRKAYVEKSTGAALMAALRQLRQIDPRYGFIIYDIARPLSVQKHMWNIVKNTPQRRYVANSRGGGPHNFGMAVDLGLTYDGKPIDMGTPFDTFDATAHIDREAMLVKQGKISQQARKNRELLRRVMTENGFNTYSAEWWHFTRYNMKQARTKLKLLNF